MLSEYGFNRPTYEEILETKIQKAKELFGEDIDTSEQTALGKFIRIGAYDLSKAYEDLEAVYYARFPNTANGVSLDRLGVYAGITRSPATFATRTITVYGESGTEVEEIKVCGDNSEIVFHNIESFTIPESGSIDIMVECETAGTEGNIYVINDIVNPIAGVDEVAYVGSKEDTDGSDIESDYEFRQRMAIANVSGSCNANSVISAILRVPTVISAGVVENAESTADKDGRPPHSFECYVYGGVGHEQEIAEAIFSKKAPAIKTCSTVSPLPDYMPIVVKDNGGQPHNIYFTFAGEIPVYINIQYKKDSSFEIDGETQITNALVEYVNNLGIGKSVVLSKLYEHIYAVGGVTEVTLLELSTDGTSYAQENISVSGWQSAETSPLRITFEVVE